MFLFRLQIYKKVSKPAIPRNGDADVYRNLGIARFFFNSVPLHPKSRKSAVMIATPERQRCVIPYQATGL